MVRQRGGGVERPGPNKRASFSETPEGALPKNPTCGQTTGSSVKAHDGRADDKKGKGRGGGYRLCLPHPPLGGVPLSSAKPAHFQGSGGHSHRAWRQGDAVFDSSPGWPHRTSPPGWVCCSWRIDRTDLGPTILLKMKRRKGSPQEPGGRPPNPPPALNPDGANGASSAHDVDASRRGC
jgi:hypothetical protein